MSLLGGLRAWGRALVRSRQADGDLREEIAFHIERETEKNIALGMPHDEARRAALLSFGGVAQAEEAHRDVRRLPWIEPTVKDIRFALRLFVRAPLLTSAAVVTIAVAIGANAAIFSAVNAVVLRPLPFPGPDRLYLLAEENPERGWHQAMVSTANYLDWRDRLTTFDGLAAYDYSAVSETLSGMGESRRIRVAEVTGNLFATLGVRAELGRTLVDGETWDSAPATLVLSDAAWAREFGRDPSIVGRSLTLDGEPMRIVGVMPPAFSFPHREVDGWVSFRWNLSVRSKEMWRRERWLRVVGRTRSGVGIASANAELTAIAAGLARDYPATNNHTGASMTPLHDFLVGDTRTPLLVMLGAVGILLLIACGNVANLLLVHAAGRQRELALRLALGAARGRLIRQVITESLVLSAFGSLGGLALGWVGTRVFVALQPADLLHVERFGVDVAVMLYVAVVATATGILFSLAPALWVQRRDPADVLKQGSRSETASGALRRFADGLAALEVALALLMTMGAALLAGSAKHLADVDPGFDAGGVWTTSYYLYPHRYDSLAPRQAFHDELLARVRALPGVRHAALGATPLEPNLWGSGVIVRGRASPPSVEALHMYGSTDWLATLGIPLKSGRFFTDADSRDPSRIVVNETFARMFFPGENAVGQHFALTKRDFRPLTYTIIGVIGDFHEKSLMQPAGPVIVDQLIGFTGATILVRTSGDPKSLVAALRRILRDMDPQIAPGQTRPLAELRDREMARSRFFAAVLMTFAAVGLVLATIGIYGVLAQVARNRAREMGIRLALGAQPVDVRRIVVRHGVRITITGLVAGLAVALVTTRLLSALLFGMTPNDPVIFVGVVAILTVTSLAASLIPAWRASRVDPVEVLRAD